MNTDSTCSACGAALDAGTYRCRYCGHLMQGVTSDEQRQIRIDELRLIAARRQLLGFERLEIGELFLASGRPALAEEQLRKAIDLEGTAPRPHVLLALAILGFNRPTLPTQVDPNDFREQVDWLRTNHPELPETRWLGFYDELNRLWEARDWRRGIAVGATAVDQFPDNYLLQYYYAMALLHFGKTDELKRQDYKEALRHMRISAELNPIFEPAVKNVSTIEYYATQAPVA